MARELKYPLALIVRAVDRASGPLQQINSRLEKSTARLTAPFRRLGDRLSVLTRATGLPKVVDGFKSIGNAAGALGSKVLGIGGVLAGLGLAGGAAFLGIARSAQEAGGRLKNLSTITGFTVNSFAELEFAAKRSGVENEAFAAGMQTFNRSLSEARRGSGALAASLKKGGGGEALLKQLKGAKSNEEAFTLLAKAMGRIKDPGKRAVLATAAFGKAGSAMVNALKDGPAGVEALRAEYRAIVGDQTKFADNANDFGDAIDNLELSFMGLRNTAAGALFPALTKVAAAVTGFLAKNRDKLQQWAEKTGAAIERWVDGGGVERLISGLSSLASNIGRVVDKLGGLEGLAKIAAVAVGVSLLGSAANLAVSLVGLGKEIALVAFRLGSLLVGALGRAALGILAFNFGPLLAGLTAATASVWSFTVALLANPITWVVVALAALAGAVILVYKNWEPISKFFMDLWAGIKFGFQSALAWIAENLSWTPLGMVINNWEPIKAFFADLWSGVVATFQSAWEKISPIVDGIKTAMRFALSPTALVTEGAAFVGERLFGAGAAQPLGAAGALPQGRPGAGGDARVTVDFANLPRGARVTPDRANSAPLELNLGYSMVGP